LGSDPLTVIHEHLPSIFLTLLVDVPRGVLFYSLFFLHTHTTNLNEIIWNW